MKVVKLPNYNILIDNHFSDYNDFLLSISKNSQIFVVTDENVFSLYRETLEKKISNKDIKWYILKPGDETKNSENVLKIFDFLFENDAKRNDILISFGGGVITDITGLVASTYLRGINLVHIPTTIIGQIDSSIGGKTSINYRNHKNVIGTFYDPKLIICETDYLKTLPEREIINGLGELIKTGFIGDEHILKYIKTYQSLSASELIERAVNVKKEYVVKDYYDKSVRNILNFGHTVGHAIEAASNFEIPHGQAVIFGMKKALQVGVSLKITNIKLLAEMNILIRLMGYEMPNITFKEYERFLYKDKKSNQTGVRFVLLEEMNRPIIKVMSWEELKNELVNTEK
ncbi:MAG: 3-dehydroquinate synthase [Acholeplasmataceae bacterium]|jgi:3-dehydroquinate synthase